MIVWCEGLEEAIGRSDAWLSLARCFLRGVLGVWTSSTSSRGRQPAGPACLVGPRTSRSLPRGCARPVHRPPGRSAARHRPTAFVHTLRSPARSSFLPLRSPKRSRRRTPTDPRFLYVSLQYGATRACVQMRWMCDESPSPQSSDADEVSSLCGHTASPALGVMGSHRSPPTHTHARSIKSG